MQNFSTFVFNKVVLYVTRVRWGGECIHIQLKHITSAILSTTYQTLLKLMEVWQSSGRNDFAQIFL